MRQMEQAAGLGGAERKRVEAVVETLATLRSPGESLAEVAHDARNMVTALGLYCDLLDEPGVLASPFLHYGNELRLVAAASRRLVEKLVALDTRETPAAAAAPGPAGNRAGWMAETRPADRPERTRLWEPIAAEPIANLAAEMMANRNLLAALAGPAIALTLDIEGGALPVRLTAEDLTRMLVNLVKNASEAMPGGGRLQLALRERPAQPGTSPWLALTIEDNGPGIAPEALERVFESGYTTHSQGATANGAPQVGHRGLGLAISRSIVEAAGGRMQAANRTPTGARFTIELPLRKL